MAGLLDFGSNPYAGLLSEEDLAGARRQATTDALLKLSSGLFQAGAPSRTPQSLGAALAGGLQGVGAGYQNTLQQAAQQKLMQQKLQADLQSKQRAAKAQELMPNLFTEATPYQPAPYLAGAPYGKAVQAKPAGLDQDIQKQLMALGPEGEKAFMNALGMQKMMQGEAFNLSPGDVRSRTDIFGNTTQVASGAPKVVKPELASSFADAVDRLGLARKNANQYTEQELALINAKAKEIDKAKKAETTIKPPSDAQILAGGFADRMTAAQSLTTALESQAPVGVMESIYGAIPLIGDKIPQVLPKSLGGLSPERRQYLQAANNWIRANLRKESGAAIGADEWTQEYVNYFPQPGDDQPTIDQKAMFREITTQNMARAAGRQYNPSVPKKIEEKTRDLYSEYGLTPRAGR